MGWVAETLVDDEINVTYEFMAGFEYARLYAETKRNYQNDYDLVCSGTPCTDVFIAVMNCSISKINGVDVKEHEKNRLVNEILNRFGMQAASYLCHKIMFETYIGELEIKKHLKRQAWSEIMNKVIPSTSGIFTKVGCLWVTIAMLSGVAGCVILKGLLMLI